MGSLLPTYPHLNLSKSVAACRNWKTGYFTAGVIQCNNKIETMTKNLSLETIGLEPTTSGLQSRRSPN